MAGKKYADQYDHIHLLMAGRGLEQQIDRRRRCHRFRHHAVMALIHEEVEHRPPLEILAELRAIEQEILQGIEELEGMLR